MPRHYKKRLPEGTFYKNLGRTVSLTRTAAGRNQMDTADHLGISFQQLQKYETGTNRIPVDRLVSLAGYLEVPVSHFLSPGGPSDEERAFMDLLEKFEGKEFRALLESWTSIRDRQARAALLDLIQRMAALKV